MLLVNSLSGAEDIGVILPSVSSEKEARLQSLSVAAHCLLVATSDLSTWPGLHCPGPCLFYTTFCFTNQHQV